MPKQIQLTARLQTIADMVEEQVVADVGTDHAYLICALIQQKKIKQGFACDINKGPLERAYRTAQEYHIPFNQITFIQANGLEQLNAYDIEAFVIAGMGGELIASILRNAPWAQIPYYVFYLQPMTKDHVLRQELYQMGFYIEQEQGIVCGKHSYTCMKVRYTGVTQNISLHMAWSGLLWNKDTLFANAYLEERYSKLKKMSCSFDPNSEYPSLLTAWKERFQS